MRHGKLRTRTGAQVRQDRSVQCGGLFCVQRRTLWRTHNPLGDKLDNQFLFLNYQHRLVFCVPEGRQRQKYLTDQNRCALRLLITERQRLRFEEKRKTDE